MGNIRQLLAGLSIASLIAGVGILPSGCNSASSCGKDSGASKTDVQEKSSCGGGTMEKSSCGGGTKEKGSCGGGTKEKGSCGGGSSEKGSCGS